VIDRQEFVANTAIVLISHGKSPEQAAADAEALALNLEKRNVSMWRRDKDGEKVLLKEIFLAGETIPFVFLVEWVSRRYAASDLPPLKPGKYSITISALDKRPEMP
jgi:hypothetical protein